MKKTIALLLVVIMLFSLTACGSNQQRPDIHEPVGEYAPIGGQPTIGGQAPAETFASPNSPYVGAVSKDDMKFEPPVILPDVTPDTHAGDHIPENAQGFDLRDIYQNFLDDYDWSQYNGFAAVSASAQDMITYVWTDDATIEDYRNLYDDAFIRYRWMRYNSGSESLSFTMTLDEGCFSEVTPLDSFTAPAKQWRIINDTTVYEYESTLINEDMYEIFHVYAGFYDIICFTTELESLDGEPVFANGESTLYGKLFVNRYTQRIDYMHDETQGFYITFLTDAEIDPRVPANTTGIYPEDISRIDHYVNILAHSITAYLIDIQ